MIPIDFNGNGRIDSMDIALSIAVGEQKEDDENDEENEDDIQRISR